MLKIDTVTSITEDVIGLAQPNHLGQEAIASVLNTTEYVLNMTEFVQNFT